ncbi:hypothetical protein A2881_01520 [Candidatus Peribacteria bacterium RIFCSPHIGHO2_01_FULL_55_13]|nr:MAG: hypothetical protein A2881_01520 [Candidatus Peribacteria bacterium RIFCSPHIGHO2_01_FULL_55_13]
MLESINIWLSNAEKTMSAGRHFAKTIYTLPVDILLSGELGAGKTTFLQGFAKGLGITQQITSPTFALEQRYRMTNDQERNDQTMRMTDDQAGNDQGMPNAELIHIDLYRLSEKQSRDLLASTDDHTGIRCIEWPDHAGMTFASPKIEITLREENDGRTAVITFDDAEPLSRATIETWRSEMLLPEHIARHCDAVAALAEDLGKALVERGVPLRPMLLRRSAEVHDLLRFLDFRPGGFVGPQDHSKEQIELWANMRLKHPGLKHEPACAQFLREQGFLAVAEVVAVHGLTLPAPPRRTIEQQLLFYADKRVKIDERVSLEDRFADFRARYSNNQATQDSETWYREAKGVEAELFPEGIPF